MPADDGDVKPIDSGRPRLGAEDKSALWWLARWIGGPFVVIIALFYAEPLFRGHKVEIVPTVLRQEVHPYPFPPGTSGQSLAPPAIPRPPKPLPLPELEVQPEPVTRTAIAANPIAQPQPVYPQRALEAEKEGTVRLRITIAPDGSVADAVVVTAQPKGWFDAAAINGVKRWRYQPSGRIIVTEVEIEFKLK